MTSVNRRVYFDSESFEIADNLKREKLFKNISNSQIFAICLVKGYNQGIRSPLSSSKSDFIKEEVLNHSNIPYLMKVIAVNEVNNLEILADEKEYFSICEEYAKTGLTFLEAEYVQNSKNLVNLLEFEALEFFDNFIEPNL